jgi:hypothetical protein
MAFAGAVLSFAALPACPAPSCMESGYARAARGTGAYSVSASKTSSINDATKATFPTKVTLRRFDPFRDGVCTYKDDPSFEVELAPTCVLGARVASRTYDIKTYGDGTLDFIEATGKVDGGAPCTMRLDGEHLVTGKVDSADVTIDPEALVVVLTLDVEKWNDEAASGRFLKLKVEGSWTR